jgi:tRNA nucleotidyltransferase (CCA-adding enzyme)
VIELTEHKKILEAVKSSFAKDKGSRKKAEIFIKKIDLLLKKNNIKAKTVLGGSFAKGTHLPEDFDVDIFIRFDLKYKDKDISILLESAIKPLKPKKVHGSRDYFQLEKDLSYELVPVLNIKRPEEAKNITDMSPLHAEWVKKNLKTEKKDEIRLAKLFCKSIGVYGAESYIRGISGHVLDILIVKYGSFLELLKAATGWKEKTIIDLNNFYKGNIRSMNRSKKDSPIIVVDPISPERNAAAALGKEKFLLFKKKARAFLENPSENFFKKDKITQKKLEEKKENNKLLIYNIVPLEGKDDVIGSKLLKAFTYIKNKFENNSFTLKSSGWQWDKKKKKAIFWFFSEYEMLEKSFLRVGPPLDQKYHVELFKSKHKNTIEKEGRIFADVKRNYRKIERLAEDLLNSNTITERVKDIELIYIK